MSNISDSVCKPAELIGKLSPYSGGVIQLWDYTSSHCMATFRLYKKDVQEQYLTLSFVERLEIETQWKIVDLVVQQCDERLWELVDEKNSIRFEACLLSDQPFKIA